MTTTGKTGTMRYVGGALDAQLRHEALSEEVRGLVAELERRGLTDDDALANVPAPPPVGELISIAELETVRDQMRRALAGVR